MNNKPFFDFIRQLCGGDELEAVITEMNAFLEVYYNSGKPDAITLSERYKGDVARMSGRIEGLNKENASNTIDRQVFIANRNKLRQDLLTQFSFVVELPELYYDGYGKNLPKIGKYRLTKGLIVKIIFYAFFLLIISLVIGVFWTINLKNKEFEKHKIAIEASRKKAEEKSAIGFRKVEAQQAAHAELNKKGIPYKASNCNIRTGQFEQSLLLKPEKGSIKTGSLNPLKTYVVDSIIKNKRVGQDEYFYYIKINGSAVKGWLDITAFDIHNDTQKNGDCF